MQSTSVQQLSPFHQDALRMLLSGVSGAAAQVLSQPFKTVKVRLQNDRSGRFAGPGGGGAIACAAAILREEGLLRGLYRGFVPGACRELVYSSCRFGLYRPLKDFVVGATGGGRHPIDRLSGGDPLWAKLLAGGVSGAAGSALANPADLVMVQMQARPAPRPTPCALRFCIPAEWSNRNPAHLHVGLAGHTDSALTARRAIGRRAGRRRRCRRGRSRAGLWRPAAWPTSSKRVKTPVF